jgi:uncharacterized protein YkwD
MVHGRHSSTRPSRTAPLVAVLVIVVLAVGGWALLSRDGGPDDGTAAGAALAAGTDAPLLAALAPKAPAGIAATPGPTGVTGEVTRLTNLERAKAGCAALRVEPELQTAAQLHSRDMADRRYFSHTSPEGRGPGDRAAAQGYATWSGENIASGYPTPAAVVAAWMNSAGHRANILNCRSRSTGVGYDARTGTWTQMFGFV